MDNNRGAIEAILFISAQPVTIGELATATGLTEAEADREVRALRDDYEASGGRGITVREVAGGWRMYTNPMYADVISAHVTRAHSGKLSTAALETLAVIAYQQPISRAQVAAVRGVSVDGVVRTLATRGLIEPRGQTETTGATLWGTTDYFLEEMGMNSLEELPPLAPYLPDNTELEEVEKEIR